MAGFTDVLSSCLKYRKISIDNNLFKLHYRITVVLLLLFAFLITTKQYFGDPIDCDAGEKVDKEYLDTYCWIFSTFTVKRHYNSM